MMTFMIKKNESKTKTTPNTKQYEAFSRKNDMKMAKNESRSDSNFTEVLQYYIPTLRHVQTSNTNRGMPGGGRMHQRGMCSSPLQKRRKIMARRGVG
jgi:hypothetical protein